MRSFLIVVSIFCSLTAYFTPIAQAGSWETSGFRTASGKLIVPGMQKAEVKRDAGEPVSRHGKSPGPKKTSGNKTDAKGKGEVWTYRGNGGLYTLTFKGDQLDKIEVTADR